MNPGKKLKGLVLAWMIGFAVLASSIAVPAAAVQPTGNTAGNTASISPTAVDFGDVQVGESLPRNVTITNENNHTVEVTSVDVEGDNASVFSSNEGNSYASAM